MTPLSLTPPHPARMVILMQRPPDDIEAEAAVIASDAYYPNVVVVPTAEGIAVVGPFADATAAWVWIDHYSDYLPVGCANITPLAPHEAIDALLNQDLI